MQFRNWLLLLEAISADMSLFYGVLNRFPDETSVLILADWLEEHGFTSVANYLRIEVANQDLDVRQKARDDAHAELRKHGMSISNLGEYVEAKLANRKNIVAKVTHRNIWIMRGRK
jgi:uncharacterized protein (TIGR02996 family)